MNEIIDLTCSSDRFAADGRRRLIREVAREMWPLHDLRKIIREELEASRDIKSFADASDWATMRESCQHLRMGRTMFIDHRNRRKLAKTQAEKDAAFAPEYGSGKGLRWRKSELDAWQAHRAAEFAAARS